MSTLTVDQSWLNEFSSAFEQFVEGKDGARVGRAMWRGQRDVWQAERKADPNLGYDDALAEADAWDNVK